MHPMISRPTWLAGLCLLLAACGGPDRVPTGDRRLGAYHQTADGGWTSIVHTASARRQSTRADGEAEMAASGIAADAMPTDPAAYARTRSAPGAQAAAAPLQAGEVDDNDQFDHYLGYQRDNANLVPAAYRLDITERYVLRVKDAQGRPLPNCRVGITGDDRVLLEARTDSGGRVLFFPRCSAAAEGVTRFALTLQYRGATEVRELARKPHGSDTPWVVELPVGKQVEPVTLDLLFCLDTTGSMGDEIARIQSTLLQVTQKIRQLPGAPTLRYGLVCYRDRSDAYVTRRFGFTTDVAVFDRALKEVTADGGGDTPESMNMGLYSAVEQMDWSADALRLVFCVADAPPHTDYTDDVPYSASLRTAVAKGIKIFPVAASGLDATGSFVMRQIAQFTGGRFLFIEYGNSGASHGVEGRYATNNLDDIVVRIVRDELASYVK